MNDETNVTSFRLAPMSALIRSVTLLLLALPLALLAAPLFGEMLPAEPALVIIAAYAWIWFRFRPSRFVVHRSGIEVCWPLKRRGIPRKEISNVRVIDGEELKTETGWCVRVGSGGLWGGFGWLWTRRRGVVQMYVSRTDGYVWIECCGKRPWLITPEHPEAFVRALTR
jgi:hypothetical protein